MLQRSINYVTGSITYGIAGCVALPSSFGTILIMRKVKGEKSNPNAHFSLLPFCETRGQTGFAVPTAVLLRKCATQEKLMLILLSGT